MTSSHAARSREPGPRGPRRSVGDRVRRQCVDGDGGDVVRSHRRRPASPQRQARRRASNWRIRHTDSRRTRTHSASCPLDPQLVQTVRRHRRQERPGVRATRRITASPAPRPSAPGRARSAQVAAGRARLEVPEATPAVTSASHLCATGERRRAMHTAYRRAFGVVARAGVRGRMPAWPLLADCALRRRRYRGRGCTEHRSAHPILTRGAGRRMSMRERSAETTASPPGSGAYGTRQMEVVHVRAPGKSAPHWPGQMVIETGA